MPWHPSEQPSDLPQRQRRRRAKQPFGVTVRVELVDAKPPVWRRLVLPSTLRLSPRAGGVMDPYVPGRAASDATDVLESAGAWREIDWRTTVVTPVGCALAHAALVLAQ